MNISRYQQLLYENKEKKNRQNKKKILDSNQEVLINVPE